jgi:hypothetical protein
MACDLETTCFSEKRFTRRPLRDVETYSQDIISIVAFSAFAVCQPKEDEQSLPAHKSFCFLHKLFTLTRKSC